MLQREDMTRQMTTDVATFVAIRAKFLCRSAIRRQRACRQLSKPPSPGRPMSSYHLGCQSGHMRIRELSSRLPDSEDAVVNHFHAAFRAMLGERTRKPSGRLRRDPYNYPLTEDQLANLKVILASVCGPDETPDSVVASRLAHSYIYRWQEEWIKDLVKIPATKRWYDIYVGPHLPLR